MIMRSRQALLGVGVTTLAMALATQAFAQQRRFDIPAQDAATAVTAFALQADLQISAPTGQLHGVKASAVSGEMDARAALQILLQGTGLVVARDDGRTIVLQMPPQSGSAAGDGADGTVEALIVTAQKREEDIQDVPIAISAFTQEDLTRSQVAGGPDLMTQVPNFTFTKTNFSGYSIQIRGIGTQAVSATVDPAVAVAFNNTPFVRNRFFEQEFYDLERVEVLRGPQGTLYGRNATAGVVNIISAKPKDRYEAKLSGDLANYSSSRLEGMVNLPLVDGKAALRLAGAWTRRDGFVTNTITGEQTDGRNLWSARVSLGLTPNDWFSANLIYEHFEEDDDRLRSGKQLCHRDPGPATVNGYPIGETADPVFSGSTVRVYWTQGCLPASLYSPDSFETPNGFALPYAAAAGLIGAPVSFEADPYVSSTQSSNLRQIETRIEPEYTATTDTIELQLRLDLPAGLTLASETGFNRDFIFSFQDFNRFNTRPGIFVSNEFNEGVVSPEGVVCDPQLGCSDRLTVGDLSTAKSLQLSQEFRLSSDYDGRLNFSLGANFLRYDTEDKYYVFFNTLSGQAIASSISSDGVSPCFFRDGLGSSRDNNGYAWSNPAPLRPVVGTVNTYGCGYADTNDIHHLDDQGRNYFLSKNPYHLLSYAAFGEIYYDIAENLKLTAGFRLTNDRKTAPQIPSWLLVGSSYGTPALKVIEQEWEEPTGRVTVDWKPYLSFTDETLLYASYVHGYKAGGANPPGYIIVGVPVDFEGDDFDAAQRDSMVHPETFEPEFVDAYEVGTKNTLLDGRLTFNLNAFYYDYSGYQISQIVDRSAVNLNFDAEIWGSELEIDWRPAENLRLGFKGGYERTRLADGSSAIDLMDRTAGTPGWLVKRSFPTVASNCIVPEIYFSTHFGCFGYLQPETLPYVAPNNGEGFAKDLSGNELPNAPDFTATVTVDYTLPLANQWLATLHTDLYYQSEAWTRVFNTEGYDKLKAYNNMNVAAIFTNEDTGWTVMTYVKNVLNKDSITGAFLNSDDTGLTTNVFLTEPRLYGIRVTKAWTGGGVPGGLLGEHTLGKPYPFRLEVDGYYGRFAQDHERFTPPYATLFNADFPVHEDAQTDLDWGSGGGGKLTYNPNGGPWTASASIRYGRALGDAHPHAQQALPSTCVVFFGAQRYCYEPSTGRYAKYNFYDATAFNQESHVFADFMVGRDFGIGAAAHPRVAANLSAGLAYARIDSSTDLVMHVRPDIQIPPEIAFPFRPPLPLTRLHRLNAELQAHREFQGFGPALAWNGSIALVGDADDTGRLGLDVGLGGSVLFGKQDVHVRDHRLGAYTAGFLNFWAAEDLTPPYDTTLIHERSKNVTVPTANASLGLSYELGRVKVAGGYRWERYFGAIDAGIAERKTYDRQFDGPYFKVSVGFGG